MRLPEQHLLLIDAKPGRQWKVFWVFFEKIFVSGFGWGILRGGGWEDKHIGT